MSTLLEPKLVVRSSLPREEERFGIGFPVCPRNLISIQQCAAQAPAAQSDPEPGAANTAPVPTAAPAELEQPSPAAPTYQAVMQQGGGGLTLREAVRLQRERAAALSAMAGPAEAPITDAVSGAGSDAWGAAAAQGGAPAGLHPGHAAFAALQQVSYPPRRHVYVPLITWILIEWRADPLQHAAFTVDGDPSQCTCCLFMGRTVVAKPGLFDLPRIKLSVRLRLLHRADGPNSVLCSRAWSSSGHLLPLRTLHSRRMPWGGRSPMVWHSTSTSSITGCRARGRWALRGTWAGSCPGSPWCSRRTT